MPYYPTVQQSSQQQIVTNVFLGYNRSVKIGEGNNSSGAAGSLEFHDMNNLTSSYYPLMASRAKRGIVKQLNNPHGICGKAKLAVIDGTSLFYNDLDVTSYLRDKGCSISNSDKMLPKQIVSMGAYIVIFPDKIYFNTENYTDCGNIDAHFTSSSSVSFMLCDINGADYDVSNVGPEPVTSPANGELWVDTSEETHVLKQYSANNDIWVIIPTVYVKISTAGIDNDFSKLDAVTIGGITGDGTDRVKALNGSKVIYNKGSGYIVIIGLIDETFVQRDIQITVKRQMPSLDYITEAENRLWGCKYGLVNGKTVNEIYCCALGDFKNWNRFLGISTDSYVASVGTDGKWTGAATHLGHPIFFKEDVMHKVYISSSGAHSIVDTACRGVQDGCSKSIAVVNEKLYYKSRSGIMVYDGSLPVSVSDVFGDARYSDAAAGAIDNKYYVSMNGDSLDTGWKMFVLDTAKGLWHKEEDTHAIAFARCGGELYYIDASTKKLIAVNGRDGTPEESVYWFAETGLMGYTTVEHKYVSRFNLRMVLPKGSRADIYLEYDSDGIWHHSGHMTGIGTNTFMLPIRPRRCDHFRVRIEGEGEIKVYSMAKILEVGSDF